MTASQLSLFEPPEQIQTGLLSAPGAVHRDGTETETHAAEGSRRSIRERVLLALCERGDEGAIPEQIKFDIGYEGGSSAIRQRLNELREMGLVDTTGDHRGTRLGKTAEVFIALPEGVKVAAVLS